MSWQTMLAASRCGLLLMSRRNSSISGNLVGTLRYGPGVAAYVTRFDWHAAQHRRPFHPRPAAAYTLPMARFLKMHGCGNDFVVFDERAGPLGLTPRRAAAIADRRTGVGCDQSIAIEPPEENSNADA